MNDMGEQFTPIDNIYNEMLLKNGINNRIVDLNEGFDEVSIYKLIYMIERIVKMDELANIPMKDRSEITIRINSYGGYVHELWSAINIIENLKKKGYIINTVCMGKSMSCGFILFLAGTNRYMYPYSTLMYHSVSSGTYGKVQEMKESLFETERLNEMAKKYTIEKTNITKEQLDEIDKCKEDWYIDSKEALKLGIATEIL